MAERTRRTRRPLAFRRTRRRGYTLVFFAMFLFALMALAALVIDIGFARLTQRQMQTAVNAAALEGLRFRDDYPPGYAAPTSIDEARRQQASDIVTWTFDDNLNPNDGDSVDFGAGPVVEFSEGVGDPSLVAGQLMNVDLGNPVYKPTRNDDVTRGLELNAGDAIYGDMVAGIFNEDGDHVEESNYSREDFTPKPAITDPNLPNDDSFLVRMRRLHNDLDTVDTEDGVSSKGPEIPYVFGRGSLLPFQNPNGDYLPRKHGITARATAIADARHLMSVGAPVDRGVVPSLTTDVSGYSHLGVSLNPWSTLPIGVVKPAQLTRVGQIHTLAETRLVSIVPPNTITVQSRFGFSSPIGSEVQFHDRSSDVRIIRTLAAPPNDTTWTLDPGPSIDGLDVNNTWIAVREADCGIHVGLSLLETISASDTVIRVNAGDDLLDSDNESSLRFKVEIEDEVVTLVNIDDIDPALWTVERPNPTSHSAGTAVYVRDARVLAADVATGNSTIVVKSLVRNVDPDNHAAAKYLVVIGGEEMWVDDISLDTNGFPTVWTVSRPFPAAHSVGDPVRPPSKAGIINGINRLEAGVSASQTTLAVRGEWNTPDPDLDPALAFAIRIDDEWIRVVDFDESDEKLWTVQRGYGNTNSAPHFTGDDVLNASPILLGDALISAVGTQVPSNTAPVFSSVSPIYNQLDNRIVGFGLGTKRFNPLWDLPSQGYVGLSLQKVASRIVGENASGVLVRQFAPDIPSSNVSQRTTLVDSLLRVLNANVDEPALVAISAR